MGLHQHVGAAWVLDGNFMGKKLSGFKQPINHLGRAAIYSSVFMTDGSHTTNLTIRLQ